jgi:Ion transport protein
MAAPVRPFGGDGDGDGDGDSPLGDPDSLSLSPSISSDSDVDSISDISEYASNCTSSAPPTPATDIARPTELSIVTTADDKTPPLTPESTAGRISITDYTNNTLIAPFQHSSSQPDYTADEQQATPQHMRDICDPDDVDRPVHTNVSPLRKQGISPVQEYSPMNRTSISSRRRGARLSHSRQSVSDAGSTYMVAESEIGHESVSQFGERRPSQCDSETASRFRRNAPVRKPIWENIGDAFRSTQSFCNDIIALEPASRHLTKQDNSRAMYCMMPDHWFRKRLIKFADSMLLEMFVLVAILANSVFLVFDDGTEPDYIVQSEIVFITIFTLEMLIKIFAHGFLLAGPHSYLRDPWNWLDFIVVVFGLIQFALPVDTVSGLRAFRLLRPLRAIHNIEGMRLIVTALISALPSLLDVLALLTFLLVLFGIVGLQIFGGKFDHQCAMEGTLTFVDPGDPLQLCTTGPYGRNCPAGQVCLPGGPNPNNGITSFDNILVSWMTIFHTISLDNWASIMNMAQRVQSEWSALYFVLLTFLGSFFVLNLIVAVIFLRFDQSKRAQDRRLSEARRQRRREKREAAAKASVARKERLEREFEASCRSLVVMEETLPRARSQSFSGPFGYVSAQQRAQTKLHGDDHDDCKHADIDASLGKLSPRRCPLTKSASARFPTSSSADGIVKPITFSSNSDSDSASEQQTTPAVETLPWSKHSQHASPLDRHIHDESLFDMSVSQSVIEMADLGGVGEDESSGRTRAGSDPRSNSVTRRMSMPVLSSYSTGDSGKKLSYVNVHGEYLRHDKLTWWQKHAVVPCSTFVNKVEFRAFILLVIICNTVVLSTDHQDMSPTFEQFLNISNVIFAQIFALEMILKWIGNGMRAYFSDAFDVFDGFVVVVSELELFMTGGGSGITVLRTFRLLRVLKFLRDWHSLRKLLSVVLASVNDLLYFSMVLVLFIFIFAVLGMQLFRGKFTFDNETVRPNFDSFGWSVVTVFQIISGENWSAVMFDATKGVGWAATLYFVMIVVIGNFIMLSLFLAIMLGNLAKIDRYSYAHHGELERDSSDRLKSPWTVLKLWFCHACIRSCPSMCSDPRDGPHTTNNRHSSSLDNEKDDMSIGTAEYIQSHLKKLSFAFSSRHAPAHRPSYLSGPDLDDDTKADTMATDDGAIASNDEHTSDCKDVVLSVGLRDDRDDRDDDDASGNSSVHSTHVESAITDMVHHVAGLRHYRTSRLLSGFHHDEVYDQDDQLAFGISDGDGDSQSSSVGFSIFRPGTSNSVSSEWSDTNDPTSYVPSSNQSPDSSDSKHHGVQRAPAHSTHLEASAVPTEDPLDSDRDSSTPVGGVSRMNTFTSSDILGDFDEPHSNSNHTDNRDDDDHRHHHHHHHQPQHRHHRHGAGGSSPTEHDIDTARARESNKFRRGRVSKFMTRRRFHRPDMTLKGDALFCLDPDSTLRQSVAWVVSHRYFEAVVFASILISGVFLAIDSPQADLDGQNEDSALAKTVLYVNWIITITFTIEMLLKVIAFGFVLHEGTYLRDLWNILDFIIVVVSWADIASGAFSFFKGFRALRALRPLRLITRFESMRLIINSLFAAVPALGNVMLVCFLTFTIFGILGVWLFKGHLRMCFDGATGVMRDKLDRAQCEAINGDWQNERVSNFDNFGSAMLMLFEIASLEGWPTQMLLMLDSTNDPEAARRNASPSAPVYFIVFIVVGSYFILSLFVTVVVDEYNQKHSKFTGAHTMSSAQRQWLQTYKNMTTVSIPSRPLPPFESLMPECLRFGSTEHDRKVARNSLRRLRSQWLSIRVANPANAVAVSPSVRGMLQQQAMADEAGYQHAVQARSAAMQQASEFGSQVPTKGHRPVPFRKAYSASRLPSMRSLAPSLPPLPELDDAAASHFFSQSSSRSSMDVDAKRASGAHSPPVVLSADALMRHNASLHALEGSNMCSEDAAVGTVPDMQSGSNSTHHHSSTGSYLSSGTAISSTVPLVPLSPNDTDLKKMLQRVPSLARSTSAPDLSRVPSSRSEVSTASTLFYDPPIALFEHHSSPMQQSNALFAQAAGGANSIMAVARQAAREKERIALCDMLPWDVRVRLSAYELVQENEWFERVIMILIGLNAVVMCTEYADASRAYLDILDLLNFVFAMLFVAEVLIKWVALGLRQYFNDHWNRFDFFVVVLSIIMIIFPAPPDPTVFRVMRVIRVFRLIKRAHGMQQLIRTLVFSLPALYDIGILLLLLLFMYACTGMELFGDVRFGQDLNQYSNFRNLGKALLILYQLCTGDNWNGIMHDCSVQPPECIDGVDCGNPFAATLYFYSFSIISSFLLLNVFVAVVLKNFEVEVYTDPIIDGEKPPLTRSDIEDFAGHWADFTLVFSSRHWIPVKYLGVFINTLPGPMGLHDRGQLYGSRMLRHLARLEIPQYRARVHYFEVLYSLALDAFLRQYPEQPVDDIKEDNAQLQCIKADVYRRYPNLKKTRKYHYDAAEVSAAIIIQRALRRSEVFQARMEEREAKKWRERFLSQPNGPGGAGSDWKSQVSAGGLPTVSRSLSFRSALSSLAGIFTRSTSPSVSGSLTNSPMTHHTRSATVADPNSSRRPRSARYNSDALPASVTNGLFQNSTSSGRTPGRSRSDTFAKPNRLRPMFDLDPAMTTSLQGRRGTTPSASLSPLDPMYLEQFTKMALDAKRHGPAALTSPNAAGNNAATSTDAVRFDISPTVHMGEHTSSLSPTLVSRRRSAVAGSSVTRRRTPTMSARRLAAIQGPGGSPTMSLSRQASLRKQKSVPSLRSSDSHQPQQGTLQSLSAPHSAGDGTPN